MSFGRYFFAKYKKKNLSPREFMEDYELDTQTYSCEFLAICLCLVFAYSLCWLRISDQLFAHHRIQFYTFKCVIEISFGNRLRVLYAPHLCVYVSITCVGCHIEHINRVIVNEKFTNKVGFEPTTDWLREQCLIHWTIAGSKFSSYSPQNPTFYLFFSKQTHKSTKMSKIIFQFVRNIWFCKRENKHVVDKNPFRRTPLGLT